MRISLRKMSDVLSDPEGFKALVIEDLAHAVDGLPHKMHIFGLEAGPVIVNIAFDQDVCGGIRPVLDVLRDLERQAGDPMSKLRQGRYTCHAKSLLMRHSTLSRLQPQPRPSRPLSASERMQEQKLVDEIGSNPKTPRAPLDPAGEAERLERLSKLRALPSIASWWIHTHTSATSHHVLDLDGDGKVDEDEVSKYLSENQTTRYGAALVQVDGAVLYNGGNAQPYKGVNGDYERTQELCNGRPVYVQVNKPTTAMWWTNNDGKISWCVGPKDRVGTEGMWAYVESMGFGPEEAGSRAWVVYSYNTQLWEEQNGVVIIKLDPPDAADSSNMGFEEAVTEDMDDVHVIEEGDEGEESEDFDAAVAQAEARRDSAPNRIESAKPRASLRMFSGKVRPLTSRQSFHPQTGSRSRPMTGSRNRPRTGGTLEGRPLTPLERRVEDALVQQIRSRPKTPSAPSAPAESDNKHKIGRGDTGSTSKRPSTAQRLLEKQRAAAAAVAAEKQRLAEQGSMTDEKKKFQEAEAAGRKKKAEEEALAKKKQDQEAAEAAAAADAEQDENEQRREDELQQRCMASALKLQRVQRGHSKREWFRLQKKLWRLPGHVRSMGFEQKYPSAISWKLPRKRGLAIDQGLWDTPWRMLQGSDWRDPNSWSVDLTVLRHSVYGTIIELKHLKGSGKSFVFKPTTKGDTPKSTPGNTPRHADKVKICRDDAYVADWRFNAANLVKRMEDGEGTKLPGGPISFGCWNFSQTDPAVVCDEVFEKLDTDGSGAMEAHEVYEAAQIMGFTDMSEDMVMEWIKEHDEDGNGLIDKDEFKQLIGIGSATHNMKVTTSESSCELWLTPEGFIMLAHEGKNESVVCIGGNCLPYTVPKNSAWHHLGRADEALKRTEFAAMMAAKNVAEEEERKMMKMAEDMAKMKKENEKLAKIERRHQREAEAKSKSLVLPSS